MVMPLPARSDPRPLACKVCGHDAPLVGVVDFSKNCEERRGVFLPLSGHPVYYRRCGECGFLFTDAFDGWTAAAFADHIYNEEYVTVDPEFVAARAIGNAKWVANVFRGSAETISVLDYGGGNGSLARLLEAAGFAAADTYDPFVPPYDRRPERRYDLVTCFETLEHVLDPKRMAEEIAGFLGDDAMAIVSTLLQPEPFEPTGLSWWYVAPRNGHVSIQSRASMVRLWRAVGLSVCAVGQGLFIVFRRLPAFAAPVIRLGTAETPVPG